MDLLIAGRARDAPGCSESCIARRSAPAFSDCCAGDAHASATKPLSAALLRER